MKSFYRLTLALLIAPICHARQIPAHIQEIIPTVEIEIIDDHSQSTNQKPPVILQSVANVLANVAAIVNAPRDKDNVRQGVTGILANIINIALVSGKRDHRSHSELFNIICDELNLDDAMKEIIKQKIEELNKEVSV
jgi:hypothetical protein